VNAGLNRRAARRRASADFQTQGSESFTAKAMPEAAGIRRLNGRYDLAPPAPRARRKPRSKFWIFSEKTEKPNSEVRIKGRGRLLIFFPPDS
jgi:hypothetical protein